ncbi:T9SS type A sorting domain-containing protein [Bacteroidota bacterium]
MTLLSVRGGAAYIQAPSGFNTYFWSGVQGNQSMTITQSKTLSLVVEDGRGCQSESDTQIITVYTRPVLNLGPDTVFCSGQSKYINLGAGYASYQWSDNSTAQSRSIASSDTLWAKVQESVHQCWSLPDTIRTKVNKLPVVNLGNDTSFCQGKSVILDAGPNFKAYYWSNGPTSQKQTISNSAFVSVIVKDFNNCLSIPDTIDVRALTIPVLHLGPDTAFCRGDSVVLDAGSGYQTYWWSNGFSSSKQVIYNSITIMGKIQDAVNACWSKNDTIRISVNELPVKSLGSDRDFCEGTSVILDVGSYFNNYVWSNGFNGKTLFIYTSDTIGLSVQDPTSGCWSLADTVVLTMLDAPLVNLGPDSSLCIGDSLLLDAGTGFVSYQWSDAKTSQTRIIKNTKTLWVQVNDSNSCTSLRDTISIVFHALPHINLGIDTAICDKEEVLLDAGSHYSSWHWSDGYNQQNRIINSTTVVSVFVIDQYGCISNTDTVKVHVFPLPQPFLGNDTLISLNDTLILKTNTAFPEYHWNDGSNKDTLQIIANDKGVGTFSYWVLVTDQNGCSNSDTLELRIYDPVSIEEISELRCRLYPVPSHGMMYIEFEQSITENTIISITDMSSKIVYSNTLLKNSSKLEFDISHLSAGIYLLKIQNASGSGLKRFIKN